MKLLLVFSLFMASFTLEAKPHKSLVPEKPSNVPDYFSTWNIQGYVVSYDGSATPRVMTEQYMFGNGPLEGWTTFFPEFREDLIFLMDDSWDVPVDNRKNELMGSARMAADRFPSCKGSLKKERPGRMDMLSGGQCSQRCQESRSLLDGSSEREP